jgi:hypothetical protein
LHGFVYKSYIRPFLTNALVCKRAEGLCCATFEGEATTSCVPACPTCADLRKAALTIVGDEAIDALTDVRLAAEGGLSVEELKRHYATAALCLYQTYDEVALSIYRDFERCFAAERGWRDGLRLAASTLLGRMAARPAEARLCFAEILRGDCELLRHREASRRRLHDLFMRELGKRCEQPGLFAIQLELLIGAEFQAIAAAVGEDHISQLPALDAELESRAHVFEPVAA